MSKLCNYFRNLRNLTSIKLIKPQTTSKSKRYSNKYPPTMVLTKVRHLLKSNQLFSESSLLNMRSLMGSKVRFMNNTVANEKKDAAAEGSSETEKVNSSNEDLEKLNKEIASLTEKNNELLDKYKRALADGENLRSRLTKQISEAKIYGIQSFCKDLLEVSDVLSRATESVPSDEISDKNPHLKSLYEGLLMTEKQLKSVFKRHGLEPVNPLNEKFNPNFHEALFQQEVKDKEAGTVVIVSKIGYKLHERVIRPALVGVAK